MAKWSDNARTALRGVVRRVHLLVAVIPVVFTCTSAKASPELRQLTSIPGNETQVTYSPAGDWIAFTSDQRGNLDVKAVNTITGEIRDVATSDANENDPQWSPDGTRISYTSTTDGASTIWVASITDGANRQITGPPDNTSRSRWSPRGEWVAFLRRGDDGAQTWINRSDGADKRQITTPPGDHFPYGWSPDGQYVLVIEFGENAQDIYGISLDGDTRIQISNHEGEEWWPQWSPQGDQVVFYSTWDNELTEIWTVDVSTQSLTRVTNLPAEDFRPAWSPDGNWIAYLSDRVSKSGIWVSSADGSRAFPVATRGRSGELHSWSPNGRWLAFSYLTSKERLHKITPGLGDAEPMTDGTRNVIEASVSPDERYIAFESEDVGTEADLFLFDIGTGTTTRLTQEITYNARPSWSPDGTHLAIERSAGGGPRTTQVGVINVQTGAVRELTTHGYVRQPIWCKGTIIFTRKHSQESGGVDQLWAVEATGGNSMQLTTSPGHKRPTDCSGSGAVLYTVDHGDGPQLWQARVSLYGTMQESKFIGAGDGGRWSSDESHIAFFSTRDGTPDLYTVPRSGGNVTRVTNTPVQESWPNWLGHDIVYGVNLGGRDVWLADFHAILAKSGT